ncbi:hypothetical protein R6Z07F_019399 [Ovis aries]
MTIEKIDRETPEEYRGAVRWRKLSTTDAGVLGIPVIEMLMKHSVHVQQKCLFSKLIEYICIEEALKRVPHADSE